MKNKQHLIALDLDGTLLNDEKKISPHTKNVIQCAIEQGHIVIISTGRPHRASIQYYQELGLDTPMVNFNGALIHHPVDKKWDVLHNPMPKRTALSIVEACYDLHAKNILAEIGDNVYLDKYDEDILNIFAKTSENVPFTIGNLKSKLNDDPTSLLIYPHPDHIQEMRDNLDEHHAEIIEHRKWGAPWEIIEIVKKGINKAIGVDKIAYYYGIPKERIIAFGDEDNDLEMIDYAGVGVAMGNAIDELKSIANVVTKDNNQDGIGDFLADYLKITPAPASSIFTSK